jgi:hypothetical protein
MEGKLSAGSFAFYWIFENSLVRPVNLHFLVQSVVVDEVVDDLEALWLHRVPCRRGPSMKKSDKKN